MGEEKKFSIVEIIFKLIGGGVTPVGSQEYDDGAAERLDVLFSVVASLLAIIRELMNRFSGHSCASCKTIGIMCTDFLRQQGFEDEHADWTWEKMAKPTEDKLCEVLLRNGNVMTGTFHDGKWWVNYGFVMELDENGYPHYSASSVSDIVVCWRNYKLPDGFKIEV